MPPSSLLLPLSRLFSLCPVRRPLVTRNRITPAGIAVQKAGGHLQAGQASAGGNGGGSTSPGHDAFAHCLSVGHRHGCLCCVQRSV